MELGISEGKNREKNVYKKNAITAFFYQVLDHLPSK
jgi:hypothetical protein